MTTDQRVWNARYRPVSFRTLAGQSHISTTLSHAVEQDRLAHAYLFAGSRGTGKTSMARILARAINCTGDYSPRPCLVCRPCTASLFNKSADLFELDAASNRGVDEIRSLREKVGFSPTTSKYKIYLLDEAHALTTTAAEALLKTLEEPPAHVIFILATTEPNKLPQTIISRCQRYDFKRISISDITEQLRFIATEEHLSIDDDALSILAQHARGSLRDAVGNLERVSITGGHVATLDVATHLGIVVDERVALFITHLLSRKLKRALDLINSVTEDGLDPRQFTKASVDYARSLMLIRAKATDGLPLSSDELLARTEIAQQYPGKLLVHITSTLSKTDYRDNPHSYLPLELAAVACIPTS